MNIDHSEREKKNVHTKTYKIHKKNVPSKITINMIKTQLYTILISLILWLTFILVMCLNYIFMESLHDLTFASSCPMCIQLSHDIYIIIKNHPNLYNYDL
jgi:hypothetical protein